MPTESDITISKGEEKGVPTLSTNNSQDATSKTHQMEASGQGTITSLTTMEQSLSNKGKQAWALSSETQMGKLWHLCPS